MISEEDGDVDAVIAIVEASYAIESTVPDSDEDCDLILRHVESIGGPEKYRQRWDLLTKMMPGDITVLHLSIYS